MFVFQTFFCQIMSIKQFLFSLMTNICYHSRALIIILCFLKIPTNSQAFQCFLDNVYFRLQEGI